MKSTILVSISNILATILMRYIMVLTLFGIGTITSPYSDYDVWRGMTFVIGHMLVLAYLGKKYHRIDKVSSLVFWINVPFPLIIHLLRYYEIIDWKFIPIPY